MRTVAAEWQQLEDRLRQGGGAKKIEKQHADGKLTARERIHKLIDPASPCLEIGLLVAGCLGIGAIGVAIVTGAEITLICSVALLLSLAAALKIQGSRLPIDR